MSKTQIKKSQASNKRIAKNTLMLYIRQILIMFVGLYTVRVVLKTLGIEDYGIYNVVSGTVTMFGFFSGAMAVGSQRFFSFYIGKNDARSLSDAFHCTLTIYVVLALSIVVLGESIGIWFINNKLIIPESRLFAANCIFQISIISFVISMLSSPFMAVIMSHEEMGVYAKVGIVEVLLKLAIVFALVLLPFDKLICYGVLLFLVSIIIILIYGNYCVHKYVECSLTLKWDKQLIKEITEYSGWNLFGNFAWIVKNQGTSFMLNIFFGPVMNAAQNLAMQIRTIVNTFSTNFTSSVHPQIVKLYAKNEYKSMFSLMGSSCKLSFMLMVVITVPMILNLDYILSIWLVDVPAHAATFTKIMLVEASFEAMSTPTAAVNQATGKIKYYQMIIGFLGIVNLPISYLFLTLGFPSESVYIISLILQTFIILNRMVFLERIEKKISIYILKDIFVPCFITGILSYAVCYFLYVKTFSFTSTVLTIMYEVVIVSVIGFIVALNVDEKKFLINVIRKSLIKLKL